MIIFYKFLTIMFYPLFLIFIFVRKTFKKEDPLRYKEKILPSYFKANRTNNTKLIWFHAASIGELKSIIPIVKELNNRNKNIEFLITTSTLSSSNLIKDELKEVKNFHHRFLPIDVGFLIKKFIKLWKPNVIFLVDSEIWPNLMLEVYEFKIPIALLNARLTSKSIKRWMFFPKVAKKIFSIFDLCLCSNNETKNFLIKLNIRNVYFKGNLKLANKIDEEKIKGVNKDYLQKKRFWFAANTHKGEEIFCLKTHLKLKEKFSDVITIIAPRHIERTNEIESLSKKFNLSVQILNKDEKILKDKEIILVNHFGVLQNYFKYTKSTYIGKSMVKKIKDDGGQNPIEAAKLKCKIYHGPYVYNFHEIYKILEENSISKRINSYEELSDNLIKDLESPLKENNQISNPINDLGEKTLTDTMRIINNFIYNDTN